MRQKKRVSIRKKKTNWKEKEIQIANSHLAFDELTIENSCTKISTYWRNSKEKTISNGCFWTVSIFIQICAQAAGSRHSFERTHNRFVPYDDRKLSCYSWSSEFGRNRMWVNHCCAFHTFLHASNTCIKIQCASLDQMKDHIHTERWKKIYREGEDEKKESENPS